METSNLKKWLKLSGIVLVVAGLVATLILVGKNQFFNPEASSENIVIKDVNGSVLPEEEGVPVTRMPNVQIQLIPPDAPTN